MTAYDPYLRGPSPVASVACEALTPILVRERGVVDDDLEVALGVLLVAEGVLDLRDRRVRAREEVLAHAGGRVRVEDAAVGTGLVLALATLARAEQPPVEAVAADLEADVASVQKRIPSQRAALRREFGIDIEFRASCANTAMVQVCAEKYYPYVECLYEAAAIHASDGDLVCTELDCAAALGSSTSGAVAARPMAALVVAVAKLVLYWAAAPVVR